MRSPAVLVPGLAVAAIFGLAMLFPWNDYACDTCGENPDNMLWALLATVLIVVGTSLFIGATSTMFVVVAALFCISAAFAYFMANALNYELAWRGVSWNSGETSRILSNWNDAFVSSIVSGAVLAPIGVAVALVSRFATRVIVSGRKA